MGELRSQLRDEVSVLRETYQSSRDELSASSVDIMGVLLLIFWV